MHSIITEKLGALCEILSGGWRRGARDVTAMRRWMGVNGMERRRCKPASGFVGEAHGKGYARGLKTGRLDTCQTDWWWFLIMGFR